MLLSRVALSNIRIAHLAKTISFSLTTGRKKFKCPQAISFCTERHQNSPFSKIYFFFPYNWKDQIHMSLVTLCFTEQHQNSPFSKNYFFFPYNWKEEIQMSLSHCVALSNIRIACLVKIISFSLTTRKTKFICPQSHCVALSNIRIARLVTIFFFFSLTAGGNAYSCVNINYFPAEEYEVDEKDASLSIPCQ